MERQTDITSPLDEIVRRHCAEAEAAVHNAGDFESAQRIAQKFCENLERECSSALVIQATRRYVNDLVKSLFHRQSR